MLVDRPEPGGAELLEEIERRVIWLAVRSATAGTGAVSAAEPALPPTSAASIVTALWFGHLDAADRVSFGPTAWPLFLAAQHLLGNLDLRDGAGTTSGFDHRYVDVAASSPQLALAAALGAAAVRRFVDGRFGAREPSRFVALAEAGELDLGAVASEPAARGMGALTWVVDVSAGDPSGAALRRELRSAGWHTVELRHGRRREARFAETAGKALRSWLERVDREETLAGLASEELRKRFLDGAPAKVARSLEELGDDELALLAADLGGHDHLSLLAALRSCDEVADRPSALFAYTDANRGLPAPVPLAAERPPLHGDPPRNVLETIRLATGVGREDELARFQEYSAAGRWCAARGRLLARPPRSASAVSLPTSVPPRVAGRWPARSSTLDAFDRLVGQLRQSPAVAPWLVTIEPQRAGAASTAGTAPPGGSDAGASADSSAGHDFAACDVALFAGQLGLAHELSAQRLLPVATICDAALVCGAPSLSAAVRAGAGFLLAGPARPAGRPTGTGAPSSGALWAQLPGVVLLEPAFHGEIDWLLADALATMAGGSSPAAAYLRLSDRVVDQAPFDTARRRTGDERMRALVVAGAYLLADSASLANDGAPAVDLLACGAVVPEALEAAAELAGEGVAANVVVITSPGRCYDSWRSEPGGGGHLGAVVRPGVPLVTVHDAPSQVLAWAGSALGVAAIALGADDAGRPAPAETLGSLEERYRRLGLLPGQIVNAALLALERSARY